MKVKKKNPNIHLCSFQHLILKSAHLRTLSPKQPNTAKGREPAQGSAGTTPGWAPSPTHATCRSRPVWVVCPCREEPPSTNYRARPAATQEQEAFLTVGLLSAERPETRRQEKEKPVRAQTSGAAPYLEGGAAKPQPRTHPTIDQWRTALPFSPAYISAHYRMSLPVSFSPSNQLLHL